MFSLLLFSFYNFNLKYSYLIVCSRPEYVFCILIMANESYFKYQRYWVTFDEQRRFTEFENTKNYIILYLSLFFRSRWLDEKKDQAWYAIYNKRSAVVLVVATSICEYIEC